MSRADHSSREVIPAVSGSNCDREASIMRKSSPTGGGGVAVEPWEEE
jgi:hypothetical protein